MSTSGRVLRGTTAALLCAVLAIPHVAMAATRDLPTEIRLEPGADGRVLFGDGAYDGELEIVARAGGLGLVEHQTVDGYLAGIREVPFSWPEAALEAQAVAARTYLAWTLRRGRSAAGRGYGFDICASTTCQVYRGAGVADGPDGSRWLEALRVTRGEILVHDGEPAQALYSASAGTETRAVEEIWGGDGLPYLVRVASPETGVSPFDAWVLEIPLDVFTQVLRAGGVPVGADVTSVTVDAAPGRVSTMRIESASGVTTLPLTRIRAIFNVHGPALYPGLFPGDRADGRRLPQSVPSYSFEVNLGDDAAGEKPFVQALELPRQLAPGEIPDVGTVFVSGAGWGHAVGMSQWGAYAMASEGASAGDILSHYYSGLDPSPAGELLPDGVAVGLAWGRTEIEFVVVGEVALTIADRPGAILSPGRWRAEIVDGGVRLTAIGHDATIYPQGRLVR